VTKSWEPVECGRRGKWWLLLVAAVDVSCLCHRVIFSMNHVEGWQEVWLDWQILQEGPSIVEQTADHAGVAEPWKSGSGQGAN